MPPVVVAAITAAVAAVAAGLNRYPDREFTAPARRPSRPTSRRRGTAGGDPSRSGPATAPTRCSSTCSRRSAGPGARRSASRPPTRCTRSSARPRARRGSTGCAACRAREPFDLDPASAVAQVRAHRPDVVFLCSPNNPTGTALALDVVEAVLRRAPSGRWSSSTRRTPSSPGPGTPSALTLLRGPAAARRHPHDEQGVRPRRRPARLPRRRPGRSPTRCGWCGCRTTCPPRPRRSRWPPSRTPTVMLEHRRGDQGAARPHRRRAAGARPRPGAERRQLRALRRARRRARDVARRCSTGASSSATSASRTIFVSRPGPRQETDAVPRRRGASLAQTSRTGAPSREQRRSPTAPPGAPGRRPRVSVEVELDLDGTGAVRHRHRRAVLRPHARLARQALADRPGGRAPRATPTSTPTTPSRTSRSCSGRPCARRWATRAASPGSATPRCRSTRRWCRPSSTSPGAPTSCTPASPTGQEYVVIGGTYVGSLTRHVSSRSPFHAAIALHVRVLAGRDPHHVVEAQFKAFARALRAAVARDPRVERRSRARRAPLARGCRRAVRSRARARARAAVARRGHPVAAPRTGGRATVAPLGPWTAVTLADDRAPQRRPPYDVGRRGARRARRALAGRARASASSTCTAGPPSPCSRRGPARRPRTGWSGSRAPWCRRRPDADPAAPADAARRRRRRGPGPRGGPAEVLALRPRRAARPCSSTVLGLLGLPGRGPARAR